MTGLTGATLAITGSSQPKTSAVTDSATQSKADDRAVLGAISSNESEQSDGDEQTADDEQKPPETTPAGTTTSTQTFNAAKPASNGTTPKQTTPSAPKADYNLNEGWLIAVTGGTGTINTCWPAEFTIENEAECSGPDREFVGVGLGKTEDAAYINSDNRIQQSAAAAKAVLRKGGPLLEATPLSESLCAQYGLSCGRY